MRRVCLRVAVALLVVLVPTLSTAQSVADQKKVVAFLFGTIHSKDAQSHPVAIETALGTAFFVRYPDPRGGPNYGFYYLVTAKHVLRDTNGTFLPQVKIRLNLKSQDADPGFGFTVIPVTDSAGNLLWFHSRNDSDDAVLIPFLPDLKTVEFSAIPTSFFVDETSLKSDAVQEGDNLYFIGLMAQFFGVKRNFPVIRRGTLALMTDEQINTPTGPQKAFIAELQSWPGNSGSPVFLNLGGLRGNGLMLGQRLRFLGILAGGFLNQVQGDIVGGPQVVSGNSAEIGVSYIVPAARIAEILNSQGAQKRRDAEMEHLLKSNPASDTAIPTKPVANSPH